MRAAAVLTAAGSGQRLGSALPKALVPLGGVPLVVHAARALLDDERVERIVVTVPAGTEHEVGAMLRSAALRAPAQVVPGGPSRQASVAAGLTALVQGADPLPDDAVVLVHDAARPLVPVDVVRRVVDAVRDGHDAVVPGVPLRDTVKHVGADQRVTGTPDRSGLRAVQTPQGFRLGVLRRAHAAGAARAADEATAATDDAALVEAVGGAVLVVAGDPAALKVTDRLDLAVAELLLAGTR